MITVDIRPAKQRFSRRKQWRFTITAANGRNLSDRDTYANVNDVLSAIHAIRDDIVRVRVHYDTGNTTTYLGEDTE